MKISKINEVKSGRGGIDSLLDVGSSEEVGGLLLVGSHTSFLDRLGFLVVVGRNCIDSTVCK